MPIILTIGIILILIFFIIRRKDNAINDAQTVSNPVSETPVVINTASTASQLQQGVPQFDDAPPKIVDDRTFLPMCPVVTIEPINFVNDDAVFNARQESIAPLRTRLIL